MNFTHLVVTERPTRISALGNGLSIASMTEPTLEKSSGFQDGRNTVSTQELVVSLKKFA